MRLLSLSTPGFNLEPDGFEAYNPLHVIMRLVREASIAVDIFESFGANAAEAEAAFQSSRITFPNPVVPGQLMGLADFQFRELGTHLQLAQVVQAKAFSLNLHHIRKLLEQFAKKSGQPAARVAADSYIALFGDLTRVRDAIGHADASHAKGRKARKSLDRMPERHGTIYISDIANLQGRIAGDRLVLADTEARAVEIEVSGQRIDLIIDILRQLIAALPWRPLLTGFPL
jgi:hypothetical protein